MSNQNDLSTTSKYNCNNLNLLEKENEEILFNSHENGANISNKKIINEFCRQDDYIFSTNISSSLNKNRVNNNKNIRVLICTESFHPYTSGIARRFKEIIRRLADRGFLIHILTGSKVCIVFILN